MKTLIVEDNTTYSAILRESLQCLFPSMIIHEATEGNEALQKVHALRPELIFMDIRLPGANGLQLTQSIKKSYPGTNVIILTSYDTPEYREAVAQCGATWFIAKDSMNLGQVETLVKLALSEVTKFK